MIWDIPYTGSYIHSYRNICIMTYYYYIFVTVPESNSIIDDSGTPMYDTSYKVDIIKSKKPHPSSHVKREKLEQYSKEVLIIIHTVNDNEKWAAVDCLDPPDLTDKHGKPLERSVDLEGLNWIVLGEYGGYQAALIQTEMGSDAGPELLRAFDTLPNAKYVIVMGVCYSAEYKKGDIIVSTLIDCVSNIKFHSDNYITASANNLRFLPIAQKLRNVFARGSDTWTAEDKFICTKEGRKPIVKAGCVISTSVSADSHQIQAANPESIAREKEGSTVLIELRNQNETTQYDLSVIVIKGVIGSTDIADDKDDESWKLTATLAAARYAKHKLKETSGFLGL